MLTFEKMKHNEIEIIIQTAQEIWREYSTCFITEEQIEYMLEKFQSATAIKQQLKNDYEYYFIKKNNDIAGYFAIQPQEKRLFLSKLYLNKQYRNQGIGRKAFEFIKTLAQTLKCESVELTVNKFNVNSIKCYKNWGMTIKEEAQFDIGSGFVMDDYIFEYKLVFTRN